MGTSTRRALPLLLVTILLAGCTGSSPAGEQAGAGAERPGTTAPFARDGRELGDVIVAAALRAGSVTFRTVPAPVSADALPSGGSTTFTITGVMAFTPEGTSVQARGGAQSGSGAEFVVVPGAVFLQAPGTTDGTWRKLPADEGGSLRVVFGATSDLLQWSSDLSVVKEVLTRSTVTVGGAERVDEENTVVVRGAAARRVADIYLTEYQRLFMHFVFRNWATLDANDAEAITAGAGHLDETSGWTERYYRPGGWRERQRRTFARTGS